MKTGKTPKKHTDSRSAESTKTTKTAKQAKLSRTHKPEDMTLEESPPLAAYPTFNPEG